MTIDQNKDVQPIEEQDGENGEEHPMMLDQDGNPIELTQEQINLIETLNQ